MAPTRSSSARFTSGTMAQSLDLDDRNNDGLTIDQGIACVLMLVALALTYLIH
ncbi:hypothetical protein M8C21_007052 [Ambrosia artemisiifolia]|uniref:Uncharacterized protein n=1 Tax=Ambrosia artemisiifolia TaxID=4212 RepID=A0AAD5BLG0_AMBAR|nr:hypothetical protein M8C21_007052 [Ambrosia artemisiifolia]